MTSAEDTVSALATGASSFASDVSDVAATAASSMGDAAGSVSDAISSVASSVTDTISDVASEAADLIASSPLFSAAMSYASQLANRYSGLVRLVGTKLVITLPQMPLFSSRTTPLLALPSLTVRLPFVGAGAPLGPVLVESDIALEVALRPEMIAVVGPADVRGVRVELDPLAGTYSATGTLHASASNSLITPVEAGLDVEVNAVIMTGDVPIPVQVDAVGGVRLALRGSGLGSLAEAVNLIYSGGALSLDTLSTLKLGARIDAELDASVELNIYREPVCRYTWPIANWLLAENAEQYDLPLTLAYADGAPTFSAGPVATRPIPVTDIEARVPTLPRTRDCSPLDRLIDILCARGVIPPEICALKGHGGGAEFAGPDDGLADPDNADSVTPAVNTPTGSFVVNRPGHHLHGTTVTCEDPRNKHTRNAEQPTSVLKRIAGTDPNKQRGGLRAWARATEEGDTRFYGSQIGAEGLRQYLELVRTAVENGRERASKFYIDAGFDYGVDVEKPWPLCSTVRVDGVPNGAHIIPED